MNSVVKIKKCIWVTVFILICGTVTAQRRYYSHHFGRHPVTTVVVKPATMVRISQRVTQKERLEMAIAYLNDNEFLSIKEYAKITGLTKKMAEAELDVFSYDREKPLIMVIAGKKKLYTLEG